MDSQVLTICREEFFDQVNGAWRFTKAFRVRAEFNRGEETLVTTDGLLGSATISVEQWV